MCYLPQSWAKILLKIVLAPRIRELKSRSAKLTPASEVGTPCPSNPHTYTTRNGFRPKMKQYATVSEKRLENPCNATRKGGQLQISSCLVTHLRGSDFLMFGYTSPRIWCFAKTIRKNRTSHTAEWQQLTLQAALNTSQKAIVLTLRERSQRCDNSSASYTLC